MCWSLNGKYIAVISKQAKLYYFDPRSDSKPKQVCYCFINDLFVTISSKKCNIINAKDYLQTFIIKYNF